MLAVPDDKPDDKKDARATSQAWAHDVIQLAKAGDWAQAIKAAGYALDRGMEHPLLLQVRAIGRERAGDLDAAIADLERGLTLEPGHPGVSNALALCLDRCGRRARAVEVLGQAADAHPEVAETFYHLGAAQMTSGDLTDAAASFERVLALQPDHAASLGKLALIASHRGDGSSAQAYAERALQQDASEANALRVRIECDLDAGRPDAAADGAQAWLARPDLAPNARLHALGLLGDALDAQARYDEAFQAYSDGAAVFLQLHGSQFGASQTLSLASQLKTLGAAFSATADAAWAPAPSSPAEPGGPSTHVFLMGFMRSGTTLLEQALSRHPAVATLEETETFAGAGGDLLTADGIPALARLDPDAADRLRQAYWRTVRAKGVEPSGKVFIDKLPFNGAKLPLIAKLFPQARIIFAVRDPRDVVLSCFTRRLQPNAWSYELSSLETGATLYSAYMELVRRYRAKLRLNLLEHRHEQLVADFDDGLAAVCAHIGLEPSREMADFAAAARAGQVGSQTARQLQDGLNTRGVARWRAYAGHLRTVAPRLQPWIDYFGYASADASPPSAQAAS